MVYTSKIKDAIKFSIETHEIDQKQRRKGKDIPYITHPLTVGLILSQAGANEDVIVAGILHDTVEDSITEKKVTSEILVERFGQNVAVLVLSVTETRKDLPWEERKREALEHIKTFTNDMLLVKSGDIIANSAELIDDYEKYGDETFSRFNAPKEKIIENYLKTITAIMEKWSDSPLAGDLNTIKEKLELMNVTSITEEEYLQLAKIAQVFLESGVSENPPKFVIMTGGVGSGKTTIRREKYAEGYINFEPNEIANLIKKKFGEGNSKLEIYANFILSMIFNESIEGKKNMVIEIIGDDYDAVGLVIDKMKNRGYDVSVEAIYCEPDEAYARHIAAVEVDEDYYSAHFTQGITLYFFNTLS